MDGMMMKGTFVVSESTPKLKFEMKNFEITPPPGLSEGEETAFRERQAKDPTVKTIRELVLFGEVETPSTIWIDAVVPGELGGIVASPQP